MRFNEYQIEPGALLKNAQLAGIKTDLWEPRVSLVGANLQYADLRGARLQWVDLAGADLSHANLNGADLSTADAEGANFDGAWLCGADLSLAVLVGATFKGAILIGANFSTSNLEKAVLKGANILGADFRGANLTDAALDDVDLTLARLDPNHYLRWSRGNIIYSAPQKSRGGSRNSHKVTDETVSEVLCIECQRNPIYQDGQCRRCYVDDLEFNGRGDHQSRHEIDEWRREQEREMYGEDD